MTELYINDKRVFFDDSKQIKITVENPYFSFAGSYSLEITIPMGIYQNKEVFGHKDRIEVAKRNEEMPARLVWDNRTLINGKAKITKITRGTISIQLTGRMTGDKFFADYGDDYIDKLKIGSCASGTYDPSKRPAPGVIGEYVYMPVYDETNSHIYNPIGCELNFSGIVYSHGGTHCVQCQTCSMSLRK